jgi:Ni/Co efflux regulator RcnB
MKINKTIISALIAASLSTGGFAFAQDHGNRNDRGNDEQMRHGDQQDHRDDRRQHDDRGHQDRGHRNDEARRDERGAGPEHNFHRGERLPAEYRNRQYVVDNWRAHHLTPPPRGYHWVQTGGDYVLVSIGSGVILQLFLGN